MDGLIGTSSFLTMSALCHRFHLFSVVSATARPVNEFTYLSIYLSLPLPLRVLYVLFPRDLCYELQIFKGDMAPVFSSKNILGSKQIQSCENYSTSFLKL